MLDSLRLRSLLAVGVSASALLGLALPAYAAEADAGNGATVGEVVVTAQKKEERLQDVPIAVSAFSQDNLQKSKIDGGPNLVLAIPNVNFSKGNFTGYNFQIRGIGTKLVAASGDSATGIHLNNAPLTANNLFEAEFFDVERVEVLRGPQGTLYGRNATGGVVNVITNKPVDHFEASLRLEGGNYGSQKARGMINLPLGDTLALRVAGVYLKRDGYGTNTVTGRDVDNRDLSNTRVSLQWKPNDRLTTDLIWDHFNENDRRSRIGKQFCTKDTGPATVGGLPFSANSAVATIQKGFFSQGCQATSVYSANVLGTPNTAATLGGLFAILGGFQTGDAFAGKMQDPNVRNIESFFDPIYRSKSDIYELNVAFDLNEYLKLNSLTSYSKGDLFTRQDYNRAAPSTTFNATPNPYNLVTTPAAFGGLGVPSALYGAIYAGLVPGGFINDPQNGNRNRFATQDISSAQTKQISQELRLQSSMDGPFNFNVGAIYLNFKAVGDYYVMFNTGTGWYRTTNTLTQAANPLAPTVNIDPNYTPDRSGHNYYDSYGPYELTSKALFGEVYFKQSDDLKWTLGLRYTDDQKSIENFAANLGTSGSGPTPRTPYFLKTGFQEFTGKFGFDWKPHLDFTNSTLIYATYSRGYKSGGLNSPCSIAPGVICGKPTFAPEFINSYEVGTKNTLLDGSLLLNSTAFYYDYKGYQVAKIVNRASTNENLDAKVKGFELETIWTPIRPLRFNMNVGYLDTQITSGRSVDNFNRTQGDPNLIVVKSSAGSNCVVTLATARNALGTSNFLGVPFTLLSVCSAANFTSPGTGDGVEVSLKGKELPNAPHYTFSFGAQYTMPIGSDWTAVARADYYKQTETFSRIYNSAADRINGWDNVNLTMTVSNNSGWALEGFVKNATNEKAITDTFLADDSSGLFRNAFFTEPRTWGVAVSKKW